MKRLFLSVLIFYPVYAILHYGYVLLRDATDSKSVLLLGAVFFFSTWVSVYLKIKKDGRIFTLKEKLVFVLFTWGVWAASVSYFVLKELAVKNADPTVPGLMIVGIGGLVNFTGVWLVISTYANKIFEKQLNQMK